MNLHTLAFMHDLLALDAPSPYDYTAFSNISNKPRANSRKAFSKKTPIGKIVSVRIEPKTGRNELCTCGSGKKYKHCCLGQI
jgi:uncharacterized protein YchJ